MDSFTCNALEFNKVLNHLSSFCRSEAGKKEALSLRPYADVETIHHKQKIYDEYNTWKSTGDFNLIDFPDISIPLAQIGTNTFHPEAEDFWAFRETLKLASTAVSSVRLHEKNLPTLFDKIGFPLPEMSLSALIRCIADNASFKDESSPKLLLVRTELRSLHQNCLRKVKEYTEQYNITHYLQDDYMTIVGDRYALPLKANFKGRLQGIIHDYSKTGETLYFEPMFLVELNNQLQELKQEEREEERKIIKYLTTLLIQEENSIQKCWEFLLELDLNEAKLGIAHAYYKLDKNNADNRQPAHGYCVSLENHLSIYNAKHPLLLLENNKTSKPIQIQAIDLIFRSMDKVLVISGGNAGGKTVALKTLGLITLMTLSGLPVPVGAGSCIIPWTHVHAFIGDEQSLDNHVSTFTGQIQHLAQTWDKLDSNHLLLLDEFGAGTDPSQGAALAQAVLDGILEKGSYAVSATHFPALKTYALTRDGVRAASVLFDNSTKKPLFHLAYDQVGASQALDVAKEHGLAESILKQAAQYLLMDNEDSDLVMSKLNALAVERESQLVVLQAQIEKTKQKRLQLQENYEKEKNRLNIELRTQSQELMRAWKSEKINAKQAMKEIAQLRAEVTKKEQEEHASVASESLKVGIEIIHRPWQKKAIIQELDEKNQRVKINLGGISMWAAMKDIDLLGLTQDIAPPTRGNIHFSRPNISYTLDLRGKRADLALSELTQFLDKSLLAGPDQVEIIHGRGTGALRKSVHQFLKTYPGIESYMLAAEDQGGDGMTIVNFR